MMLCLTYYLIVYSFPNLLKCIISLSICMSIRGVGSMGAEAGSRNLATRGPPATWGATRHLGSRPHLLRVSDSPTALSSILATALAWPLTWTVSMCKTPLARLASTGLHWPELSCTGLNWPALA